MRFLRKSRRTLRGGLRLFHGAVLAAGCLAGSTTTPGVDILVAVAALVMATVTRTPGSSRLLSPTVRAETRRAGRTSITASAWQASATGIGGRRSPALANGAARPSAGQHRAAVMQGQAAVMLVFRCGRLHRRDRAIDQQPLAFGKAAFAGAAQGIGIEIDFLGASGCRRALRVTAAPT